jgi:hypothetical protein
MPLLALFWGSTPQQKTVAGRVIRMLLLYGRTAARV